MQLSADQSYALDQIEKWLGSGSKPYMTVGGYAGTGKSTLIRAVVDLYPHAKVCAYTGKAASVLTNKGIKASTIHRLIYEPYERCKRSEIDLTDQSLCSFCAALGKKCEPETKFRRMAELGAELVIVDEASMVDTAIFADLMSYDVPVLFVGDHGQLEPIKDNPRLMVDPDVKLETIHRQSEDSPILTFAHEVRRGMPPRTTGDAAQVLYIESVPPDIAKYDAVLAGRNRTRCAVNAKIRALRGHRGDLPEPGESVVCLRNDAERQIYNGMTAAVVSVTHTDSDGIFMTVEEDGTGSIRRDLPIDPSQFGQEKTLKGASRRKTLWDFGYCLTVHKSQGSEYSRVCVLEWIHPEGSAERWRYTAATRAKDELVYCVHPSRRRR